METWWAANRTAAPDLFAREFLDTLTHILTTSGAGARERCLPLRRAALKTHDVIEPEL